MRVENPRTGKRYDLEPGVRVSYGRNGSDAIEGSGEIVQVNRKTVDLQLDPVTTVRIYPRHIRKIHTEEV